MKRETDMPKRRRRSRRALSGLTALFAAAVLLAAGLGGCGGGGTPDEQEVRTRAEQATAAFLDACGNFDTATVLSMLSSSYKEANGLGDTLTPEALKKAAGTFISYRFDPVEDIIVEPGRVLVTADINYGTFGTREETLALVPEGDGFVVDSFTAMDWTTTPVTSAGEDSGATRKEGAEKSLRSFVDACLKGDTGYVFKNLSDGYKARKNLEQAWTASEFAGIFGEARSYEFEPGEMEMVDDNHAEADVTIDFGSRGNLESETSRVSLVWEDNAWRMDVFPFFLY